MSKTLKILSRPNGNAEEYGRWSVNPYKGCSHGCLYCYLKKGVWANGLGGDTPVLKEHINGPVHAYHLAMAEILENKDQIVNDGGLFMTFTSDPCADDTWHLFFSIAVESAECGVPVTILTKANINNNLELKNSRLYAQLRCLNYLVAFGFTLTGHDELEPNAGTNYSRILSMQMLRNHHFNVWASIEPVIDFPSALDMVYQAVNAGCQHFKIGLLTNNTRLVRKDFAFGGHHFDAYKVNDCLHFVEDVMRVTSGKATVYWKQSVRDLLDVDGNFIYQWPNSVGKGWSMFGNVK
jgi:DNA repair photolyase